VLRPPPLSPGDKVRVIAPSGPFDHTLVLRGLGWLSKRYRVEFDRAMFQREGFLAGNDDRRLRELNAALSAPDVRAVIAARGGYGLTRIAPLSDVAALARHPKWVVGFSDITALHVEVGRAGLCSLHARNAAELGRGSEALRREWSAALEVPDQPRTLNGLEVWRKGHARGPLAGGNLTVLFTCAASGRLCLPEGCILFLEDVDEAPYRIDRMLTALWHSGALDRVAGVLLGSFTQCGPGRHGVTAEEVLRDRTSGLGVPVLAGAPAGHALPNVPLPLGYETTLDSGRAQALFAPPR
jgi:muramoyltetrapeptide carboxypeptidase